MNEVTAEMRRLNDALTKPVGAQYYDRLYVAQQALAWANQPDAYRSPYDMVMGVPTAPAMGTPEDSADYSASARPLQS